MSSSINNFVSPFYTSIIGNDNNQSELQAEIDDLKEDLTNNYYDKIESDVRYLNQTTTSKWNLNYTTNTLYPKDNAKIAVAKITAETELDVSGVIQTRDIKITSGLIAGNTKGTPDQVLKTDGVNVYWGNDSGSGQQSSKWVLNGDIIYPENNKKVGINTTNVDADSVLQVAGNTKISGNLEIAEGNVKTKNIVDIFDNSGNINQILTKNENGIVWTDISSSTASKWYQSDNDTIKNNSSSNVDISGNLLINNNSFATKYIFPIYDTPSTIENSFNIPQPGPAVVGINQTLLGTINQPSDYHSFTNLSYNFDGRAYTPGSGHDSITGGIKILDGNDNVFLTSNIEFRRQNLDDQGNYSFNINEVFQTNSIVIFPLKVYTYVYEGASTAIKWINFTSTMNYITTQETPSNDIRYNLNVNNLLKTDIKNNVVDISGKLNFNSFNIREDASNNILYLNKNDDNFMKMENYTITTTKQLKSQQTYPQIDKTTTGVQDIGTISQPSDWTERSKIQLFLGVEGVLSNNNPYPLPHFVDDLIWFELCDKNYNVLQQLELKDGNYDVNDGTFAITYYDGNYNNGENVNPYDIFPLRLRVRKWTYAFQLNQGYSFNMIMTYYTNSIGKKTTFSLGDVYATSFNGKINNSSLQSSLASLTSLGIGKSIPLSANLDVSGTALISNNLTVNGDFIVDNNLIYVDSSNNKIDINGETKISTSKIKIGISAGQNNQQDNAVAIGNYAGQNTQSVNGIAIGNYAGQDNQDLNSIAIGYSAGQLSQGESAVAIGNAAGNLSQGINSIAIGRDSGFSSQQTNSVAIGYSAGKYGQKESGIAIGTNAAENTQGIYAISIGKNAGQTNQGGRSVAIGIAAGGSNQGEYSVAVGSIAGNCNQGDYSIGIGYTAGWKYQKDYAIAIGNSAGTNTQGTQAIAIGYNSASSNQGQQSLAIGQNITSTFPNSICVNTTGTQLISDGSGRCFVKPIRNATNNNSLYYNSTTGEITYSEIPGSTKNILCMTASNYTIHYVILPCGTGSSRTYANIITTILNRGSYNHSQGSLCGSTLDTVNKRFNINETGKYLLTFNGGVFVLGGGIGHLAFDIFINNSMWSNPPTNTVYWSRSGISNINGLVNTNSHRYLTLTLNSGDFIDIRAVQMNDTTNVSGYYIVNGATITLKKI